MNKKLTAFLDNVCIHIRCRAAHKDICTELSEHIDELKVAYSEKGYADEQALDMAISDMGDTAEIGTQLNKRHKPQTEWLLIALISFICIVGASVIFCSNDPHSGGFGQYLVWAVTGAALAAGVMFFNYTNIKKWALPLYLSALGFLIFGLTAGVKYNGEIFMPLGLVTVSASLAIVPFVLAFVGFMHRFRGEGVLGIVKLIFLGAISIYVMFLIPNMANVLILFVSYTALLFTAVWKGHFGGKLRIQKILLLTGYLLLLGFLAMSIIRTPYQLDRLFTFITHDNPNGSGWQNVQLTNLLSASKWLGGVGAIDGYAPYYMLPALTTELALANVIITFGWTLGIALILVIIALIVRLFMIVRKIKYTFGFYLALAACVILSMQFIISVLMNLGLFPIIAIGLPFVSYGGSAYVSNMVLVGVILSVWRRNNIIGRTNKPTDNLKKPLFEYADGRLVINLKNK